MYNEYNDYELLNYISENNEEANNILFKKYEPLIISLAKQMIKYINNSGIELNDLIQEGMLGLSNATLYFKDSKETLFFTYAKTCIERKMLDLVISTRRLKNKILNESISFETTNGDDNITLEYLLKDNSENPENILLNEEMKSEIYSKAKKNLTDLEFQVFELKINGFDYKEIAEILDMDTKKIDNALQRIKTKLRIIYKNA